jgi:biotin carboxyl carrier protein
MKLEAQVGDVTHAIEVFEDRGRFRATIDGRTYEGDVLCPERGVYTFYIGDRVVEAWVKSLAGTDAVRVRVDYGAADVRIVDPKRRSASADGAGEGRQTLVAPMPGKVVAIVAAAGSAVERGQGVVVVEAMKMQNEVKAPKAGLVTEVRVSVGDTVNAGQALATIE